jgi:hypothetical protein
MRSGLFVWWQLTVRLLSDFIVLIRDAVVIIARPWSVFRGILFDPNGSRWLGQYLRMPPSVSLTLKRIDRNLAWEPHQSRVCPFFCFLFERWWLLSAVLQANGLISWSSTGLHSTLVSVRHRALGSISAWWNSVEKRAIRPLPLGSLTNMTHRHKGTWQTARKTPMWPYDLLTATCYLMSSNTRDDDHKQAEHSAATQSKSLGVHATCSADALPLSSALRKSRSVHERSLLIDLRPAAPSERTPRRTQGQHPKSAMWPRSDPWSRCPQGDDDDDSKDSAIKLSQAIVLWQVREP